MKNYALSDMKDMDARTFILNYEIKNGQIIINFASKEKLEVPYTEENEKKIKEKMEAQVRNAGANSIKQKCEKYLDDKVWLAILLLILITIAFMFTIAIISTCGFTNIYTIAMILIDLAVSTGTFYCSHKFYKYESIIRDFEKNELFLKEQNNINDNIKGNPNILANVSQKTKALVDSAEENEPVFNINNIDNMSLKELKQIIENIRIAYPDQEELDHSQEETSHEAEKPKVNIKKIEQPKK